MPEGMSENRRRYLDLMNSALKDEIYFSYQPIYNLFSNKMIGTEALLRSSNGIGPSSFFEKAQKTNCLQEADCFCLAKSMKTAPLVPKLFVNVYPSTLLYLSNNGGLKKLKALYPPEVVTFEIVEAERSEAYLAKLESAVVELKKYGYSIAIDDVGSGFERLLLISLLEPEYIKIDRPLIKNLGRRSNQIIVKNLLNMSKELNSFIIAEGIETKEELEMVKEMKIQYGQGYLLGKPRRN